MVDGPVESWDFTNLWTAEDSLTYFSDTERDVFVFEIDGDGDGLRDRDERRFRLGELDDPDTDGDGILDGSEDPDSDGISSSDEIDFYRTDPTLPDSDGDGLSDSIELFVLGTNPLSEDSDGDGLDDGAEDEDGDGLSNAFEVGPDPGQALDTDGDGVPDVIDDDDDGDGVPTNEDACFPTPVGEVVRADGCSISQLCPCEHPIVGDEWKNHGAYVSCVAHTAKAFSAMGLIAEGERGAIVSTAAQSNCGHENK
jgi:hypothetical protein